MEYLIDILVLYKNYMMSVFGETMKPNSRIFFVYLITSTVVAYCIYRFTKYHSSGEGYDAKAERKSFIAFLFPKHVWSNPSAWLDVKYFFFHKLIGHFLLLGVLAACTAWGYAFATGGGNIAEAATLGDAQSESQLKDFLVAGVYMFVFFIVGDFLGYYVHYLQHKIPLLWEFHKVHHSAEVMHPISNFREHPIDNLAYLVIIGGGFGIFIGLAARFLGYLPTMPTVFGVPLLMFLFNIVGYNLRHSHIWLRWPGVWSKVFPSPAHHHVHHSCHPDHLDKNFAFMFPFWDVVFGTYEMPESNKDVKFGVLGMKSGEMDTCMKLYFMPFQKAYRRILKSHKKRNETAAQSDYSGEIESSKST